MDRAINALQDDDVDVFDECSTRWWRPSTRVSRRIDLAQAVITLRDQGRIPAGLAAIAVLELDRKESTLFLSSVAESLAVLAGDRRTPPGSSWPRHIYKNPVGQAPDPAAYWRVLNQLTKKRRRNLTRSCGHRSGRGVA